MIVSPNDSTENKNDNSIDNSTDNKAPLTPPNDDELIIELDNSAIETAEPEVVPTTEPETGINITEESVLQIELDTEKKDTEEQEPTAETNTTEQPTQKESKAEKIARLKKEKAEKEKAEKELQKKKKADKKKTDKKEDAAPQSAAASPTNKKKKSKAPIIFLIIGLILIGSGLYIFFVQPEFIYQLTSDEPEIIEYTEEAIETPSVITEDNEELQNEETEEFNAEAEENIESTNEDDKILDAITEELQVKEASPAPAKKPAAAKKPAQENIVTKGKLPTPCWVISYASVSKEARAIKAVANLSMQNIRAGYYWIPDYQPQGAQLFKVYVGPFQSKDEAAEQLAAVKELVSEAFITKVE